jgi:hypothetical protein
LDFFVPEREKNLGSFCEKHFFDFFLTVPRLVEAAALIRMARRVTASLTKQLGRPPADRPDISSISEMDNVIIDFMTPRIVIVALAMLLLSTHIAAAQPATPIEPRMGMLEGTVTRGPTAPVARPGMPNEAPIAEAKIQIADPSGNVVTTTRSGSDGSYSVQLLNGPYLVSVVSPRTPFGRRAPEAVTISSGQHTHLDLHVDTGIR